MGPTKRSRSDALREEITEVVEANSSLRPEGSRKRVRVSHNRPQSKEPTDDDDDDDDGSQGSEAGNMSEAEAPQSPPQTQYEMMRDNGFRHLENQDLDDLQATQALARRSNQLGDNSVAESGIIESITCYNFMCHTRLHVELGPLINFIVGENGSGKSAVLTALTLCLGGKASDTNRGGSLRSFVREGQEHGSLVVKIKNGGTDAYQPDLYGDSIIVERHFSKSGASGFKIKSSSERIISTKKQEVDEISEWYALQIGNPLTVLSQDNARQFLNSATPAQKYKYFVSGVQLEQLDNDYKMSQDTLDKTLLLRDDLDERIAGVKKEMEDADRLAQTAEKNNSLREKSRIYRHQLAWSQVVQQEKELESYNKSLQERDRRIVDCQNECDEMTEALTSIDSKLEQVQRARADLETERERFDDKVAAAEATYHDAKKELTELQREERDAYARLKNTKTEIKAIEEKIALEEQRLNESTGPERAEKDSELEAARAREKGIHEQLLEATQALPALRAKVSETQQRHLALSQEQQQKRTEVVAEQRKAEEMQQRSGSPLDGYDGDMRRLVDMVSKEASSFMQKPIGPLGAHIRLLKPEWSSLLERTFGESLNAFVVRSKQDQGKLAGLIKRAGLQRPPPIYIAYGESIDTRAQEPDDRFDTALRVLQFDNDIVRSQMVINYQIEKIILVQDRVEAEHIMFDDDRAPRNVAACICFHDGQGKRGHGLRLTNRNGTTSTGPVRPSDGRPRMQSDTGRQLALQEDHLKHLGQELIATTREMKQASQANNDAEKAIKENQGRIRELENSLRRTQAEIERIQEDLDAFEGVDHRLVSFRTSLATKQEEVEQLGSQYGTMSLTKRELHAKAEEAKSALEAVKLEREDFQSRINKAETRIKSHVDLRRITVSKKNEAFERLDIEKNERRRSEAKRDEQANRVADFIAQAQQVAPERVHIPDGETFEGIERKYRKLKEQLATRERRLGASDQEIYDRAKEARDKYEDVTRHTKDVDDTIASLKRAIENRLDLWRQFQRQISARVRIQFTYLLSERGFRGKIDLDHKHRKVHVQVEPDETRKSSAGRNTKTLSGGEKSFSSICMLLSVWEAIGSPIRCLDEFDVFMDNVNRAISTNMLVDAARRSVSRQYLLITPNAIEGRARVDRDVKIIRLTDPRQRTLV
ncbi:Chromosome segregation ATPase [Geosmithia morbida]|uniref:Chromosome segregation ATPase n=1 Tax=Geosmithia morbida TaxID=1094350 RepID=A0A9P4YV51_9HYPO|nr:Chromosome segregation ATPase [Geosmithia morbida]KAF4121559.1 Chromosome segregation ATPase [Geosmithia morbida]